MRIFSSNRQMSMAALLALTCSHLAPAQAADTMNLLARPDLEFVEKQSFGQDLNGVLKLKDEDIETAARIISSATSPTEIVFAFSGAVVTPSSVRLKVDGIARDTAKIEILASELGPGSGFISLRSEPVKGSEKWQTFRFEPVAAKWLMIKILPFGENAEFDLQEIEIEGHEGPPVNLYAFNEAPGEAFDVLQSLQGAGIPLDLHADERALFDDAADGQLDSWTFAEASLLSSGIYDAALRAELLGEIDTMIETLRAKTEGQSPFEIGQAILTFLHEGPMNLGYLEQQTDMSELIGTGVFNCVSSATLYNIIARGLGLDARGIEVPDHAFSILYDGTTHVDIETTTAQGFNPARNKAGLNEFSRTTGFTYINDKNRSKRREIGEAGMVALTYYNHGVTASINEDYPTALLQYFRALSLDPGNKSAIKNTMAVLGRWSGEMFEQDNYERAVEILDAGLRFAPSDRGMRHNMRYALTKAMKAAKSEEDRLVFVALTKDLHERTEDKTFLRIETQVLTQLAYEMAERGDYEAALQMTATSEGNIDSDGRDDRQKLRRSLFLNWANDMLDAAEYAQAVDILERALDETGNDFRVRNNIAYTIQQWGASVAELEGTPQAQAMLLTQAERFPKIRAVQSIATQNYDIDGKTAFDEGRFEDAIAVYQSAYRLGLNKQRMKRNEIASWNNWGLERVDQGDFAGGLLVFERGLKAHPNEYGFKKNVAYIVQEWTKKIVQNQGLLAAEEAISAHRARFDGISDLKRMQGRFVNDAVNSAKTEADFVKLAPVLVEVQAYATSQSRYDNMVAYFYQEWVRATTDTPESELAIAVLQPGVDAFPDNRSLRRLFVGAVNTFGAAAMDEKDWPRAMSIFRAASRSLPNERSFAKTINRIEEQL